MRFLSILLRGVFLPRSLERFLSYYRCIWVSCSAVHFYFNILLFENHTIVYMKNHLRILKQIALGLLFTLAFIARANAQACSTSNEVTITVVNDPSISTPLSHLDLIAIGWYKCQCRLQELRSKWQYRRYKSLKPP